MYSSSESNIGIDFLKTESSGGPIASEQALLNAPLHKESCSDTGIGRLHQTRTKQPGRNPQQDEQDLVVNLTSCCPIGNFFKKKLYI